jgi:hypothetical protein
MKIARLYRHLHFAYYIGFHADPMKKPIMVEVNILIRL